jgi:hypothetical protein
LGSWLGQRDQAKAQLFLHDKGRRQELYREFIDAASQLFIHALTNEQPDLPKAIALHALISGMRVLSSRKVVEEAEMVAQEIGNTYPKPKITDTELRDIVREHSLDPLRRFSESCRDELQGPLSS